MATTRPDVRRIIEEILGSPRMEQSHTFSERVFTEEPIIQRGSQMRDYLPPRCREMRELATKPENRTMTESQLFVMQGRLMADYADDVEYRGTFEHYFPTYQAMSDRQLRGYFTWRARVRAGDVRKTALSFVFVYLYELLCGIGVTPGEEAFRAIERFWWEYRTIEPKIDRYVRRWLQDYAAYHGLPRELVLPYVDVAFDEALMALRDGLAGWDAAQPGGEPTRAAGRRAAKDPCAGGADNPLEEGMFGAIDTLSSYRPRVSRLYRDRPETLRHVSCAVLARLAEHYASHRKTGLLESLFGMPASLPHKMFASAVFWDEGTHADATYEIDKINLYTCTRGTWYWEGYHGSRGKSPELGKALRAVDQRLRDAVGYSHPLEEKDVPKYLARIIDQAVAARLAWESEREARRVTIDLSKLGDIRAAASATREALLVDEEREENAATAGEESPEREAAPIPPAPSGDITARGQTPEAPATEASVPEKPMAATAPETPEPSVTPPSPSASGASGSPSTTEDAPFGLSPEELALLEALAAGRPAPGDAASYGTSVTMLVDNINEKLFDLLGDTAIEFDDAGEPHIIDDYLEDVRGAMSQ